MSRAARFHHIYRIDTEDNRTHCWRVQIQRRHDVVLRHFSDSLYGGKSRALKAALAFRDKALRKLPKLYPQWWRTKKRRNNTSGIVGVGRYVSRDRSRGREFERVTWQAFWNGTDGKRCARKFSVNLYGEQRAKALAQKARREALRGILVNSST